MGTGVVYHGMELVGGGAVLAGLILGAIAAFIIDRQFRWAAGYALAGAILAFFGFIHGTQLEVAASPLVALGYARWPELLPRRLAGGGCATGAGLGRRGPESAGRVAEGNRMAFELFVNGTLMRGLALHGNLAGAEFLGAARTAPIYRLFSIDDRHPGMFEVAAGGVAVAGEIYRMPDEVWRRVEAGEPPPLLRRGQARRRARGLGILYPRELAEGRHRDISDSATGALTCRASARSRAIHRHRTGSVVRGTAMATMHFEAEPYPLGVRARIHGTPDHRHAARLRRARRLRREPCRDVSLLRTTIEPCRRVLERPEQAELTVIHTREGHRPTSLSAPPSKLRRGGLKVGIGDEGPMGRVLVRGQYGHDIIPELYPVASEPVIDKPGKGAFHETDLNLILRNRGIKTLIVCGVTTEVCVHTTVREANDRGYECVVLSDCVGSYFPEFHRVALEMIKAQGGIFGWVSDSEKARRVLGRIAPRATASAVG